MTAARLEGAEGAAEHRLADVPVLEAQSGLDVEVVAGVAAVERLLGAVVDARNAERGELRAHRVRDLHMALGNGVPSGEACFRAHHVVVVEDRDMIAACLAVAVGVVWAEKVEEARSKLELPFTKPASTWDGQPISSTGVDVAAEDLEIVARHVRAGHLADSQKFPLIDSAYSWIASQSSASLHGVCFTVRCESRRSRRAIQLVDATRRKRSLRFRSTS
jgi:hypothetical protein